MRRINYLTVGLSITWTVCLPSTPILSLFGGKCYFIQLILILNKFCKFFFYFLLYNFIEINKKCNFGYSLFE